MEEAVGMMDKGYFVPRTEILKWVNSLLQLNITKIEQLGSGVVYLQILDVLYPGSVPMSKVNWKAKVEYDFICNLKMLQKVFMKVGIKRTIEIERLSKAKYQDNLEFIQWLKRYFEMKLGENIPEYDAIGRRNVEPDFSFAEKNVQPKLFNGKGEVIRERRKTTEMNGPSKRRGESLELRKKANSHSASASHKNQNFRNHAISALVSIQKILKKSQNSDEKVKEISRIVEGFDSVIKDLDESCQM